MSKNLKKTTSSIKYFVESLKKCNVGYYKTTGFPSQNEFETYEEADQFVKETIRKQHDDLIEICIVEVKTRTTELLYIRDF